MTEFGMCLDIAKIHLNLSARALRDVTCTDIPLLSMQVTRSRLYHNASSSWTTPGHTLPGAEHKFTHPSPSPVHQGCCWTWDVWSNFVSMPRFPSLLLKGGARGTGSNNAGARMTPFPRCEKRSSPPAI